MSEKFRCPTCGQPTKRDFRQHRRPLPPHEQILSKIAVPQPKPIEERIREQIGELKQIKLTEGFTVREFAEALGVTPRDIIQLLVRKGYFTTMNAPLPPKFSLEIAALFHVNLEIEEQTKRN